MENRIPNVCYGTNSAAPITQSTILRKCLWGLRFSIAQQYTIAQSNNKTVIFYRYFVQMIIHSHFSGSHFDCKNHMDDAFQAWVPLFDSDQTTTRRQIEREHRAQSTLSDMEWNEKKKILRKRFKNQHLKLKFVMKSFFLHFSNSLCISIVFCEFSWFLFFFFTSFAPNFRSFFLYSFCMLVQRIRFFDEYRKNAIIVFCHDLLSVFNFDSGKMHLLFNRFWLGFRVKYVCVYVTVCVCVSFLFGIEFRISAHQFECKKLALLCVYCAHPAKAKSK